MSQGEIYENIGERGYLDYRPAEIIVRQMLKLVEELSEALRAVSGPEGVNEIFRAVQDAAFNARGLFDDPELWLPNSCAVSLGRLKPELADLQVVLKVAAQAINANWEQFDIDEAALEKSAADVERGVRGE